MTAPISRERQIELMKSAAERHETLVSRLLQHPTIKAVAVTRSLKESVKVRTSYETSKTKKVG